MRHVNHGDAKPLLKGANFATQILAQLGVEIGQRLVEQAHRRFGDQGASKRHPLLLAARQLAGLASQQHLQVEKLCHSIKPPRDLHPRRAAH